VTDRMIDTTKGWVVCCWWWYSHNKKWGHFSLTHA
jgi:hypothetical protein